MPGNSFTLLDLYQSCEWDENDERLCGLYDTLCITVNEQDIYGLNCIMRRAYEGNYLFDLPVHIERKDYDAFCKEFKEVSNADNVEKETGERPFWSKEDFEIWLSKVEVDYE